MTKKVLLADDEQMIRMLITTILGPDPRYRVLVAKNGEEALSTARKEKPDLIFLDVLMPKGSGHEVCRALRQDPDTANVKVIMLTALSQESDRLAAFESGADDFLTKPFSPLLLLQKVEEVLELR